MGISTTRTIVCDYPGCVASENHGPVVVEWCMEDVESKKVPIPAPALTFVTFVLNGTPVAFCSKLHTSWFFLPDSYEIVLKKVIGMPKRPDNGQTGESSGHENDTGEQL